MKKIFALALSLVAGMVAVSALTFTWDANAPADAVTNYRLYQSVGNTGTWQVVTNTGTNVTVVFVQTVSVASYRVTALNAAGLESLPSNVVSFTNAPAVVRNLRVAP